MSTIIGIEADAGVVLAGDRLRVSDGTAVGEGVRRVVGFEVAGAAAEGDPGDVDAFRRRLESDVRRYRVDHDESPGVKRLARMAADIAEETGIEALVGGHDDQGVARLRVVDGDGAVLTDETAALGTGAQLALGRLDDLDRGGDLTAVEKRVREHLVLVAERDPKTGDTVDTWTLAGR